MRIRSLVSALSLVAALTACAGAQLSVTSTLPVRNANNVARSAPISITFDRAVDRSTFTYANFKVFGKLSGPIGPGLSLPASIAFSADDRTVTVTPSRPLMAGETVMVVCSRNLRGADGVALRQGGYTFMFTVGVASSPRRFREIARVSNRDATGAQTRIYGGLACDLNRDGWCDITTINEVSADLRVFLNRADGGSGGPALGPFLPMLPGYVPIPFESSPNEVADFNGDGFVDVVVSSNAENRIAIALGRGDGTFNAPTLLNTADFPRGFGILDVDGDGDFDITVACANGNVVQIFQNNGAGVFGAPTSIDSTGSGEYGLAAADMNNDGLLDLVVGCTFSRTVHVLAGNGQGGFTVASSRPLGGANWVITCGDLNGDGAMDVSAANSGSSNGSIVLGNGDGTLLPAVVTPTGGSTVSTDLADIDGDGDLDWILSSFGAGLWYVYLNDGAGRFSPLEQVVAPANPSCAVPMDIDNDGDIDLVLTDEIADVMVILENFCPVDFNGDGFSDPDDLSDFISCYFQTPACGDADFNSDGRTDPDDLSDFIGAFFNGC